MAHCKPLVLAIALGIGAGGAGCLVHRPLSDVEPVLPAQTRFVQMPEAAVEAVTPDQPWWQTFDDPVLNELVEQALADNLGLDELAQRVEQADALYRQAGARLFPSLSGSATYDSIWSELQDEPATRREDASTVGGLLSWELDVWGRLRSAKGAQAQERQVTYYDWLGGRLLLTAVTAETYFEILEQREQLRLLKNQIQVNETLLELNQLRFGQGLSSIVDVLQQKEQLEATQTLVPAVEAREQQLRYTLDVLLGRAPGQTQIAFGSLPAAPSAFEGGTVPSDLLSDRPDLMADQHRITGLDYRVGEAIADRLPRFEIGGTLSAVGDPGFSSLVGSAFGSVVGPLFDAGERRAVVDLRKAELEEAVFRFSNNYLTAVRDVEVALLQERKQAEQVKLQDAQLTTAMNLLSETRNRYTQGLTDYLPVLAAIATEQNLQRELITSRRELLSRRVGLYRALGGPMAAPGQFAFIRDE